MCDRPNSSIVTRADLIAAAGRTGLAHADRGLVSTETVATGAVWFSIRGMAIQGTAL